MLTFRAIEIFKVLDQTNDNLPCDLLASKKVMEAAAIDSLENKDKLEPILDCLARSLEMSEFEFFNEHQALLKFSCFLQTTSGMKLLMLTAIFTEQQSAIILVLDEEVFKM